MLFEKILGNLDELESTDGYHLEKIYIDSDDLVKRRKITIVKRMRTYLDLVSQDKDLITSVIPMGDGIAITRRR